MQDDTPSQTPPPPPPTTTPPIDDRLQQLEKEAGVTLTDEERSRFLEINKDVANFEKPKNFLFVLPNLLRGFDTKFTKASEDPKLAPELKTAELRQEEAAAANVLRQYQSEYALLFSPKEVPMSEKTMNDWHPIYVPQMHGRAKIVLIHTCAWNLLQDKSFVVRHHKSMANPESSEVYEIYVMNANGAALEFVAGRKCTACGMSPAPYLCLSCKAPYCSDFCRLRTAMEHEVECVKTIMQSMRLSIVNGRERHNQTVQQFQKEQAAFEERNRGKHVTVRRIDAEGNVLSETQEIVVPASADATS